MKKCPICRTKTTFALEENSKFSPEPTAVITDDPPEIRKYRRKRRGGEGRTADLQQKSQIRFLDDFSPLNIFFSYYLCGGGHGSPRALAISIVLVFFSDVSKFLFASENRSFEEIIGLVSEQEGVQPPPSSTTTSSGGGGDGEEDFVAPEQEGVQPPPRSTTTSGGDGFFYQPLFLLVSNGK
nr:MAG: wsv465-like protein [Chiromantes dehaani nimavirus]